LQNKPSEAAVTENGGDGGWANFGQEETAAAVAEPEPAQRQLPSSILDDLGPSEEEEDGEEAAETDAEDKNLPTAAADIRIEAATSFSSSSDSEGGEEEESAAVGDAKKKGRRGGGGDSSDTESGPEDEEEEETSTEQPAAAKKEATAPVIPLPPEDLEPRQLKKLETMRESPA
jgi:hypothetical protein